MLRKELREAIESSIKKWKDIVSCPTKQNVYASIMRCGLCKYFDDNCDQCILHINNKACFERGTYKLLFEKIDDLSHEDAITEEHINLAVKYGKELITFLEEYRNQGEENG